MLGSRTGRTRDTPVAVGHQSAPGRFPWALAAKAESTRTISGKYRGRGGIENWHSTDVESPPTPPPPCPYVRIHSEGESCSDLGRVRVLNDPSTRALRRTRQQWGGSIPL